MKTINLFFDFEFTSLSPDAQPISLGIVTEAVYDKTSIEMTTEAIANGYSMSVLVSKSFYSEYSDFDMNRCDDWVKENVVGKTDIGFNAKHVPDYRPVQHCLTDENRGFTRCVGITDFVSKSLKKWLQQFSDYNIQFVCDCGTFDWYWMLQLLAEWEVKVFKRKTKELHEILGSESMAFGLPKLPSNISPVPFDLNQLIAEKKGISVKEAFELDREIFALQNECNLSDHTVSHMKNPEWFDMKTGEVSSNKHNSLWDAKVIKKIYEKIQ
jgi:hypothetical protein